MKKLMKALLAYPKVAGSAGALFGLGYYLLLSGCGLLARLCRGRRST
ncbi:MAG: hypothetical protein ACRCWL_04515 [Aeromonas sp.]